MSLLVTHYVVSYVNCFVGLYNVDSFKEKNKTNTFCYRFITDVFVIVNKSLNKIHSECEGLLLPIMFLYSKCQSELYTLINTRIIKQNFKIIKLGKFKTYLNIFRGNFTKFIHEYF